MIRKPQLKYLSLSFFLIIFLLLSGLGCRAGNLSALKSLKEPVDLEVWGVFDPQDFYQEIIDAYRAQHINVNINYRKLRFAEYEQSLLEAWAEDRGPDIFMVHNTWISKYQNKLVPAPKSIQIPIATKISRTGKVEEADFKQTKPPTLSELERDYVAVVAQDAVRNGKLLGLPLSVDTLALYYNKDLFDQAKVIVPPRTWLEVKEISKRLTLFDEEGNLIQSGIALGTADNINRAADIVSLLMMQNGTEMTKNGIASFHQPSAFSADSSYLPGAEALRFYTDFALPHKEVYTWNEDMPNAQDAFLQNSLGMMLGYAYQLPLLKAQGPKIRLGVAEVPHINQNGTDATGLAINFANYWLLGVAKNSDNQNYAWDFILFATSAEQAQNYIKKANKPAALRNLIQTQISDPLLGIFAGQTLTARSWYRGANAGAQEEIFRDMIRSVIQGEATPQEAVRFAAQRIQQTLR